MCLKGRSLVNVSMHCNLFGCVHLIGVCMCLCQITYLRAVFLCRCVCIFLCLFPINSIGKIRNKICFDHLRCQKWGVDFKQNLRSCGEWSKNSCNTLGRRNTHRNRLWIALLYHGKSMKNNNDDGGVATKTNHFSNLVHSEKGLRNK